MAVYQDKARERIQNSLRRLPRIIEKAKAQEYKEADTRVIVSEVLSDVLGWNKYDDITAEQMIAYGYADYVVKQGIEPLMVIEVKQIGMTLRDTHLTQARHYAIDEGIDWVVLTNGDEWQVHRMDFDAKPPCSAHVFTVTLSSKEMSSKDKTALLYLISKEAYKKCEIEDYYKRKVSISAISLADHIINSSKDRVINELRRELYNSTGQILTNSEIANALMTQLFSPEVVTDDQRKALRRMQRDENIKKQKKSTSDA